MFKIYHKTIKDASLKTLDKFKIGSWIYAQNPDEAELENLAKDFSIDIDLLRDAVDPYEVPRLEIDNGTAFIFTRAPLQEKNGRITTLPLLIAVGPDFVLTLAQQQFLFFNKFLDGKIDFTTTQKTKLLLQTFSEIIYSYNNYLTTISRQVRAISIKVENITNQNIVQFVAFEGILNDFLAALVPTNTILNNLLHSTSPRRILELYEEDRDLIEDLLLDNTQLIELAKANLKTIVNIREAYSTIMTNNLNRVIKLLTALTIILTVPMIISSFYGMNIDLPFAHNPWAFWALFGSTLVITVGLLTIFVRNKWL